MDILFFKIIHEQADSQFLLSYIIQEAHPIIARYGDNQIGTILPDWQMDSPGTSIAFCGDRSVLERILRQEYFQIMVNQDVLRSSIEELSLESYKMVRFVKNQKITGNTAKAIKRKVKRVIRRQIERGEIQHAREYRPRKDQQQSDIPATYYHLFYPDSISSKRNMPLCVQLVPAEENEELSSQKTFDHYGFSTLSFHRGLVPLILPFF